MTKRKTDHDNGTETTTNRKKIGPHVDADLWARFRQQAAEKHGSAERVLGTELENAIELYLDEAENDDLDEHFEFEVLRRLDDIENTIRSVNDDTAADTEDNGKGRQ